MTHRLDAAPSPAELERAVKVTDKAYDVVRDYVNQATIGYPTTFGHVWRSRICLSGFGKVWRDERGRRTLKKIQCDYGDWKRLDELIAEAKAHYDSKRAKT